MKPILDKEIVLEELLKDNEKLMDVIKDLENEMARMSGVIVALTKIGVDLVNDKEDLKKRIKMLEKGLMI